MLVIAAALPGAAASQLPPDAEWRTFETANFRVNYMAGLDSLAARSASRAEWAHALLASELVEPPKGKIELILADNVDFANGSATPLPTNRITLYAHPPADVYELSFTTDWLELLILHELVHIFQLDHAEGLWGRLRSLLGRNALLFPQAYTPSWFVEGLATYYESSLTPGGRVKGSLFEMALRTAMLEEEFFSIDRASGTPRSWPAGSTRYIYGSLFLDFVARRHGPDGLARFVDTFGGQTLPYRLDAAARRAFGESFSGAWAAWTDSLAVRYRAEAAAVAERGLTRPELLTIAGRDAYHPRYAPDSERIAYAAATGRDQPSLRLLTPGGEEREIAPRAILGPGTWLPGGESFLFGDAEFQGPYRIFSDLWLARPTGDRRRITRSARVAQPDLHPDGTTFVAVRDAGGTNVLVTGTLHAAGALRDLGVASLDVHWAHPRWSPRGDRIAAVRWTPGGLHDIVILDAEGQVVQEITRDRAIDAVPSWSPDGRYLVFWSDRTGIPNLFAHDLERDALFQITNVLSGAIDPDVSPDGRWIVFSFYSADGYRIARLPFEPAAWWRAEPPRLAALPIDSPRAHVPVAGVPRPYSPWPSVAPAAWTLLADEGSALGVGGGVGLGGVDVVRRHLWAAEALVYPDGARFEGGGVYRYQGWGNPVIEVAASQDWSVVCEAAITCGADEALPTAALRRDQEASLSLLWIRQRIRSSGWVRPSVGIEQRNFRWDDAAAAGDLRFRQPAPDVGLRLEIGRSSVRAFEFSVGPQAGFSLVSAIEGHRYTRAVGEESDPGGYARLTERGRGYRSIALGGTRHVLALRGDLGMETGSRSPGFDVGGASGGSLPIAVDVEVFGRGLSFPIRGYPEGIQFGSRAFTASAEYRFPLLRVERGIGLIPVYLDRVTGDLFADAGTAWCPGECPVRLSAAPSEPRLLPSLGAEIVADLRFGFHTALPLRLGAAFPLRDGRDPQLYVRVGRGF